MVKEQIFKWVFLMLIWVTATSCFGQPVLNTAICKKAKVYPEIRINTVNEESSPAFVGDKVGFIFTKGVLKPGSDSYFDIGYSKVETDNSLSAKAEFGSRINSDFHEGPMSYDAASNLLFFTRTHKETRRIKGVDTDTFYLRIMTADLNASKPVIRPINLNVDRFSVCHPTLSSDGRTMVYTSNQPGGQGKMDLYIARYDGTQWTASINAGPRINSAENEAFPFLLNDTLLVFASQRSGGSGGWDVYASALRNGSWTFPELLPEPINSPYDDLGLIIRANGRSGYFASNRPGGYGADDIYRFEAAEAIFGTPAAETREVTVQIMDKLTLEGIPGAKVAMVPLEMDINQFTMSEFNVNVLSGKGSGDLILQLTPRHKENQTLSVTDESGQLSLQVLDSRKYLVTATAADYQTINLIYDHALYAGHFNVVLEPEEKKETATPDPADTENIWPETKTRDIPTESGAIIVFENIYYDYNSARILPGAAEELDDLARVMLDNPDMKIRLEAHTDSRGAAPYNLQLSVDRANAARTYLTALGIDEDRITIRGLGESRIRNQCTDGVPCTDEMHAYNRRTEVIVE